MKNLLMDKSQWIKETELKPKEQLQMLVDTHIINQLLQVVLVEWARLRLLEIHIAIWPRRLGRRASATPDQRWILKTFTTSTISWATLSIKVTNLLEQPAGCFQHLALQARKTQSYTVVLVVVFPKSIEAVQLKEVRHTRNFSNTKPTEIIHVLLQKTPGLIVHNPSC